MRPTPGSASPRGIGLACLATPPRRRAINFASTPGHRRPPTAACEPDSILATDVVTAPTGGPQTADGFFVRCPRAPRSASSFGQARTVKAGRSSAADLTLWGIGVRGLSLRVNGRAGVDLGASDVWPGTDPAVQLIEAYAEYAHPPIDRSSGAAALTSRLGIVGFDGGRAIVRAGPGSRPRPMSVWGWAGRRRCRSPVRYSTRSTTFSPAAARWVAGAALGWSGRCGDVRIDYQREVERESRQFASERAALSGEVRPLERWSLAAGVEYDLANTWFGNADVALRYVSPLITAAVGARQYRPHFDLWTIWGAFSPVPYHAVNASVWLRPLRRLELRGRWERYAFSATETETPLVDVDNDGWRLGAGVTFSPNDTWTIDAGYREEYGPGASSHGFEGSRQRRTDPRLTLTAYGSTLDRPLEFRFEEASVDVFGLERSGARERLRLGSVARTLRRRPAPAGCRGFDWNQTRLNARVTLLFGSGTIRAAAARAPDPPPGRITMSSSLGLLALSWQWPAVPARRCARTQDRFDHWQHRALFPSAPAATPARRTSGALAPAGRLHGLPRRGHRRDRGVAPPSAPRATNLRFTHPIHARDGARHAWRDSLLDCRACHSRARRRSDAGAAARSCRTVSTATAFGRRISRRRISLRQLPPDAGPGGPAHPGAGGGSRLRVAPRPGFASRAWEAARSKGARSRPRAPPATRATSAVNATSTRRRSRRSRRCARTRAPWPSRRSSKAPPATRTRASSAATAARPAKQR